MLYNFSVSEDDVPDLGDMVSIDVGGGVLSGVRTDFGLDELVNMGSTFLPGMLSEKEPVGSFIDYEQLDAAGDTAVDNEAPTPDDWDNL